MMHIKAGQDIKKIFNAREFLISEDHKWALNYTKSKEDIDLILLDLNFKGEKEKIISIY